MITEKLIEEQNRIINSKEKRISVLAGPGSGKTYTVIQKIKRDINYLDHDVDTILALSFTKEAANQLKRKVIESISSDDTNKIEATTIDAFLVNLFKWAYFREKKIQPIDFEVIYSDSKIEKSNIYRNEKDVALLRYIKQWEREFLNGKLKLSFVMPIIARRFLEEQTILAYLKKYRYVYIDEAQDLNKWQFTFFNRLADAIECNICYVGDIKQSIYGFRGARPEYFKSLEQFDYKVYEITESARCPKNIMEFSIAYHSNQKIKIENFTEIHLNKRIDTDYLIQNNNALFLCYTKAEALEISLRLKSQNIENVYYVEPYNDPSLSDENSYEFMLLLNYIFTKMSNKELSDITVDKQLSEILEEIISTNSEFEKEILLYTDTEFHKYDEYLKNLYNISISIEEIYNIPSHRYFYDKSSQYIRVLTIHSSKGLEADDIYLKLSNDFMKEDEETRNKYFVAFTRCKQNLFISANSIVIDKIKRIYI